MKKLTWAECAAIVICAILIIFTLATRLRPAPEGFTVERGTEEIIESPATIGYVAGKLDINSASADELCDLPGIGETLASRIIEYREEIGGFTDISQLTEVKGIGDSLLENISEYITIVP